jgi:hypothetical protein
MLAVDRPDGPGGGRHDPSSRDDICALLAICIHRLGGSVKISTAEVDAAQTAGWAWWWHEDDRLEFRENTPGKQGPLFA